MVKQSNSHTIKVRSSSNREIAENFAEVADLLEKQGANIFRIKAYREAARTISDLHIPMSVILETEGVDGLLKIPGIGHSISRAIQQIVYTGKLSLLEHLRGEMKSERILTTVSGIGPGLAKRIHDQLGIEQLIDLETAVYDGRLARLPEFGKKRLRAVQESLANRRLPKTASRFAKVKGKPPTVKEILGVDSEYRRKAAAGKLPLIVPKYFNPKQTAWLPVLHTQRGNRHYTALFSNTARAHELGTTHDWVVIHQDDHSANAQWTVITSMFGRLKGRRIIPGREAECRLC